MPVPERGLVVRGVEAGLPRRALCDLRRWSLQERPWYEPSGLFEALPRPWPCGARSRVPGDVGVALAFMDAGMVSEGAELMFLGVSVKAADILA